jgi:hypothetical protein
MTKIVIFVTASLLGACSPSLDWRTVELPDSDLQAVLPCRPGRFERAVVVAGRSLKLFMISCEAGGVTYALSTAEVGDASQVENVLSALLVAARSSIRGEGTSVSTQPQGATPFRNNASARFHGVRPDGTPVQEAILVFGRGSRVYEAIAIGRGLQDAAVQPFQEALRFASAGGAAGGAAGSVVG